VVGEDEAFHSLAMGTGSDERTPFLIRGRHQTNPALSLAFPLLQLSKAKAGRFAFPAAIPPASLPSGGLRGVGGGDGLGNRRADVYRVGRCLPRSRVCSSSSMAELGFAGGMSLRGGFVWAASAWRRSRCCWRITCARLSSVPVASFSSA